MMRFLSRIPIFRRVFIIFGIAVLVPAIVIILLGNFYLNSLNTRGQAEQISFDAQNVASTQQANLQRMNAEMQTLFQNVMANLGQTGTATNPDQTSIQDPSFNNSVGLIGNDISDLEVTFDQGLINYDAQYEIAASPNMATVRSIIQSDSPNSNVIQDQKDSIDAVLNTDWQAYKTLQDTELTYLNKLQLQIHPLNPQDPNTPPHVFTAAEIASDYATAYDTLYQMNRQFTTLRNHWQNVVDDAATMGKTVTAVGQSVTQPLILATALALLLSLLVVVITGGIVNFTITSPLRRLALLTRRIARGDTTARAHINGRDEIALVAQSMNNMLDNIVHLIQEATNRSENLQKQVEKLVSEVSGVGEGDLRLQAEVTADALGVLADSFNYMVEELGALVVRVKVVAQEVEHSTLTTFDNMTHLVGVGDMQIKQITGAAVEVERMAGMSRQMAERARTLYSVAHEAHETAEVGREAMQQTVEGMGRIQNYVADTSRKVQSLGENSQAIKSIIDVIARITHQTNRLALDAAIQAAMAGDNGKGFGAVAADIRRLATQAKDEADAITRIVRSVSEDIADVAISMQDTERETLSGAKLAEEAGVSLSSIFGVVERQEMEIEAINRMADQQMQSSSNVVQVMRAVTASTEQNSVSTREAAQSMERMARLAEQLLASVEAFKLREDMTYSSNAPIGSLAQNPFDQESISGIFRAVTASAQVSNESPSYPALAAVTSGNGNGYASNGNTQQQFNGRAQQQYNSFPPLPYNPDQHQGNGTHGVPATPAPYQPWQNNGTSPAPDQAWQGQQGSTPLTPQQERSQGNFSPPPSSPWSL